MRDAGMNAWAHPRNTPEAPVWPAIKVKEATADNKIELQAQPGNRIVSGRARDAFMLDNEPAEIRDRYGRNTFGQSCLLTRRLVEAGTKVVEVIWPKVAISDNQSWDMHEDLAKRMKQQSGPMLDHSLGALFA